MKNEFGELGNQYDHINYLCQFYEALGDVPLTLAYQHKLREAGITDERVTYSIHADIPKDMPHDEIEKILQIQYEFALKIKFRDRWLAEWNEEQEKGSIYAI